VHKNYFYLLALASSARAHLGKEVADARKKDAQAEPL